MRRRQFITVAVSVVAAWPRVVCAQQSKTPTIGVLVLGIPDPQSFMQAFKRGLLDRGYVESRDILLDVRSAEGRASALAELAADLVRLKVDVIVAYQTGPAQAAKQATTEIPIVMAGVGDPLGAGLIASLARPGGNVTGTSSAAADVGEKLVEFIREVLPSARRISVLANATDSFAQSLIAKVELAAKSAGFEVLPALVRPSDAFDPAFAEMHKMKVDAVIVEGGALRKDAIELALKYRVAPFATTVGGPGIGAVLAYAASSEHLFRETATYVDKILKGTKPSDLPVAQPTKFDLVINLKTAKSLGLTVSPALLWRADEV